MNEWQRQDPEDYAQYLLDFADGDYQELVALGNGDFNYDENGDFVITDE